MLSVKHAVCDAYFGWGVHDDVWTNLYLWLDMSTNKERILSAAELDTTSMSLKKLRLAESRVVFDTWLYLCPNTWRVVYMCDCSIPIRHVCPTKCSLVSWGNTWITVPNYSASGNLIKQYIKEHHASHENPLDVRSTETRAPNILSSLDNMQCIFYKIFIMQVEGKIHERHNIISQLNNTTRQQVPSPLTVSSLSSQLGHNSHEPCATLWADTQ